MILVMPLLLPTLISCYIVPLDQLLKFQHAEWRGCKVDTEKKKIMDSFYNSQPKQESRDYTTAFDRKHD